MPVLQIIGGGKMGEALLGGLVSTGWGAPTDLVVVEPESVRRDELAQAHAGVTAVDGPVADTDAILAVKPDIVPAALEQLRAVRPGRVLSIAAGVTLSTLEAVAGEGVPVIRAMPNTPALVGAGAAAIAPGRAAGNDDMDWAESILGAVGTVVRVDERDLDAVTGLSGSGPAYVFALAEALVAAGREQGLSADVASALTQQTLLGAARLLVDSDDPPAVLRANVTSPGGTTAAGLAVLSDGDFDELIAATVRAATARSVELGAS
ncbi:MAG: pyrroline-5-carboxylate reductase [Acidimicrobiales bacterium]